MLLPVLLDSEGSYHKTYQSKGYQQDNYERHLHFLPEVESGRSPEGRPHNKKAHQV